MSDEGERICPLCAEEMDLTDQQLKPCKCGYEICVWCWHHIMEMAEKDDSEGRCPACRAPYNKEKIVGMAANCERLVAEMNMEKKFKNQKGKTRTSEGRKQLSSVRVIQRNLVYIVGLPLNLAEEDLLQRKEYFGQYGKVQKVSISRTAAGTIQQFANSTCSVYITYSREEEAVRCIQAVHGFVLEGRPLRACFGTSKYCHAWLRNVPCSNPDCLYLHDIGSQEDSFSKDEIISAYTRSRVQQITSTTNNLQRHAGNVLPPPADDYLNNSSTSAGKPISKSITNNSSSCIKISPPNSGSGRSVTLPAGASWGTRAPNNQSISASVPPSNGPQNQKTDASNGPVAFSTPLALSNHITSSHADMGRKLVPAEDPVKQNLGADAPSRLPDSSSASAHPTPTTISSKLYGLPASRDKDKHIVLPSKITNSYDSTSESSSPGSVKDSKDIADETVNSLSSDMLSMSIDKHQGHGLVEGSLEQFRQTSTSQAMKSVGSKLEICVPRMKSESGWDSETPVVQIASHEEKDDLISFVNPRLKDPEVQSDGSYFPDISHVSYDHTGHFLLVNGPCEVNGDIQVVDNKVELVSQLSGTQFLSNGYPENQLNSVASSTNNVEQPCMSSNDESSKHIGRLHNELSIPGQSSAPDMGESSIISNILSLDLDTWDDSVTSPQNLVKFLGETDRHQASHRISSSWKVPRSNQSRFSFAREEEPISHGFVAESSLDFTDQAFKPQYFGHGLANKSSFHGDKFGTLNGLSVRNTEEPDAYAGSYSLFSSSKLPVSRSQITAPPGFSTPSRAPPPPGFLSHERVNQTFNSFSGHHMLGTSSLRNQYHSTKAGNNFSNGDIELMDPAILAVGKGRLPDGLSSCDLDMRSSFAPQLNNFENDARIQLLMQRSLSNENQRFTDVGDAFTSLADSLRNPSRVIDQSLANNMPSFSQSNLLQSRHPLVPNGHWDGWNEVHSGNNLGMMELLRPERFDFNKYYTGYEDSKLRMPSHGDMYNRTFGM